ncbi:MAG: helix-turn-helix transcriptional regulator [Anaerolineae bacterium]|nr:helix-turn-helix transcriptional regulator [Anaerolineae bacterium]
MRAKSAKRLEAEKLRKEQGLSYREIEGITGISRSTLSHWLRAIPLTPQQETRLEERLRVNRANFAARAWKTNQERYKRAREEAYQDGASIMIELPDQTCVDELAMAMLYLGEGSRSGGRVQMASTNPDILRYFLWALRSLYSAEEERLSFRLNLVEAARPLERRLLQWWAKELDCSQQQFIKTQYDVRSSRTQVTEDYYGVCTITYNNTYLQQRILGLAHAYVQSRVMVDK